MVGMLEMLAVNVSCTAYTGWILKPLERLSERVWDGKSMNTEKTRGQRQIARLRGQKKAKMKGVTEGQPIG